MKTIMRIRISPSPRHAGSMGNRTNRYVNLTKDESLSIMDVHTIRQ